MAATLSRANNSGSTTQRVRETTGEFSGIKPQRAASDRSPAATRVSAFWQTWQSAEPALFRLCLSCMDGRYSDAEEALATARLKAFNIVCTEARTVDSPQAWLKCMTRNLCIDLLRQRQTKESKAVRVDHSPIDLIDPRLSMRPESVMLQSDTRAQVQDALAKMPSTYSQVWKMRVVDEMEYKLMAEQLQTSEANVRKRLQFARTILRRQLAECYIH